jgi:hypothetical protein
MPPESFLHERNDFKALVETVADSEKINDPALVEKDYWIMHAVFGLKQVGLTSKTAPLYYRGQIPLDTILTRIQQDLPPL